MKTLGRTPPPSRGATPSPWSIGSHRPRPAVNLWPEVVDSQRPASPCPPPGPDSLRQPGLAPLPRPTGPDLGASSASDRPWICPPGGLASPWLDVLPLTLPWAGVSPNASSWGILLRQAVCFPSGAKPSEYVKPLAVLGCQTAAYSRRE